MCRPLGDLVPADTPVAPGNFCFGLPRCTDENVEEICGTGATCDDGVCSVQN
ncbi:MAG: hypothetical protein MHM6MM_007445 [Cercozoa sp. M6MM]